MNVAIDFREVSFVKLRIDRDTQVDQCQKTRNSPGRIEAEFLLIVGLEAGLDAKDASPSPYGAHETPFAGHGR